MAPIGRGLGLGFVNDAIKNAVQARLDEHYELKHYGDKKGGKATHCVEHGGGARCQGSTFHLLLWALVKQTDGCTWQKIKRHWRPCGLSQADFTPGGTVQR